jgi:hypothetical protein
MAYLYRQTFLLATENRKSLGSGIRVRVCPPIVVVPEKLPVI